MHIAEILGASHAKSAKNSEEELRRIALSTLARDPEWRDPKVRNISGPSGTIEY